MRNSTTLVAIVIGLCIASSSCGPPREFKTRLDRLHDDGAKLNALTSQGVAYERYAEQLASVRADLVTLKSVWPAGYKTTAQKEFDVALQGWALALEVWGRQIKDEYREYDILDGKENLDLIREVKTYTGGKIVDWPDATGPAISYKKSISLLMTLAASHFDSAIASTTQ